MSGVSRPLPHAYGLRMRDQRSSLPSSLCDLAPWEPLLRLLRAGGAEAQARRPVRVATDLALGRRREEHPDRSTDRLPVLASVRSGGLPTPGAAAHPALEVLSIGACDGARFSLAPLIGLPRLRALSARAGTLADPLEIGGLTGLEFLELGPQDWRVLLDAGAVPQTLSATAITAHGHDDPLPVVALANELLALWDRPRIRHAVLEGDLGPAA